MTNFGELISASRNLAATELAMKEHDLIARVEALEFRLTHQEAAIEELTRTLLEQEGRAREQADSIERLEARLTELAESPPGPPADEKPPHY
jgi:SlyX protein